MSDQQPATPVPPASRPGQLVRVIVSGLMLIWGVPLIGVGAMLAATGSPIGYALLPAGFLFLAIGIAGYVLAHRARTRDAAPPTA